MRLINQINQEINKLKDPQSIKSQICILNIHIYQMQIIIQNYFLKLDPNKKKEFVYNNQYIYNLIINNKHNPLRKLIKIKQEDKKKFCLIY